MQNPGLPKALWSRIDGCLWHATERESLSKITSDGEIRPEVGDRYKNSFCRKRKSVSLFDFGPTAVNVEAQFHNWAGWFGRQQDSNIAIWLEIDRVKTAKSLLDAGTARQKSQKRLSETFIPGVEACHKGSIPLIAIVGTLLVARDNLDTFEYFDDLNEDIFQKVSEFEDKLPPHPEDSIVERLRAGRRRSAEETKNEKKMITGDDPNQE